MTAFILELKLSALFYEHISSDFFMPSEKYQYGMYPKLVHYDICFRLKFLYTVLEF